MKHNVTNKTTHKQRQCAYQSNTYVCLYILHTSVSYLYHSDTRQKCIFTEEDVTDHILCVYNCDILVLLYLTIMTLANK